MVSFFREYDCRRLKNDVVSNDIQTRKRVDPVRECCSRSNQREQDIGNLPGERVRQSKCLYSSYLTHGVAVVSRDQLISIHDIQAWLLEREQKFTAGRKGLHVPVLRVPALIIMHPVALPLSSPKGDGPARYYQSTPPEEKAVPPKEKNDGYNARDLLTLRPRCTLCLFAESHLTK